MVNFIGGDRKMSGWRSMLWQDLRIQAFGSFGITVPTKVVELAGYFQVVLMPSRGLIRDYRLSASFGIL